jgi:hypothetical protein
VNRLDRDAIAAFKHAAHLAAADLCAEKTVGVFLRAVEAALARGAPPEPADTALRIRG